MKPRLCVSLVKQDVLLLQGHCLNRREAIVGSLFGLRHIVRAGFGDIEIVGLEQDIHGPLQIDRRFLVGDALIIRANSWNSVRFLLIFGREFHEFHEKDQKDHLTVGPKKFDSDF